jgi:hypothetical protein
MLRAGPEENRINVRDLLGFRKSLRLSRKHGQGVSRLEVLVRGFSKLF